MSMNHDYHSIRTSTKWKKAVKTPLFLLFHVMLAAVIGFLALWSVYSLPTASIDKNVKASSSVFSNEGTFPNLFKWCTSKLDNFTDAVMLLEASNDYEADSMQKAMLNYRGSIDDKTPCDTLIAHYENGVEFTEHVTYPRYWHGYLVWLKPLLLVFNYQTIRIINGILQIIAVIWICFRLWEKGKNALILPIALTYGMLMPVALSYSLQFSSCFYIVALSILLLLYTSKNKAHYVFLYAGVLTAYFDLLTYPIAAFGIPAVMYLALYNKDGLKKKLVKLFALGACWGFGYIGMWSLKWLIGGIITGVNVLEDAQAAIRFRISRSYNGTNYSLSNCINTCVNLFAKTPCTYLVCLYCLWESFMIVRNWRKKHIALKDCLSLCLPFVLVALLPLVWYAITLNHSTIHAFFTNKALSVSVLALMMLFTNIARFQKNTLARNQ